MWGVQAWRSGTNLAQCDGQAGGGAAVAHSTEEVEEEALQREVADTVRAVRADQAAALLRATVRRNGGAGPENVRGKGGAAAAAASRAYEVLCRCAALRLRRSSRLAWLSALATRRN